MKAREVQFGVGDVSLSGTVWAPDQEVATPGVVLVGGSGPADRSNGGYFHALRDRLVAAGVTVLAFDKRGVGGSSGAWASARVDDLAADVAAAVEALRAQPGVDRDAVGLFGHSEGGWVALRASARGAAPRYLVLNSSPAVSFLEAEIYALTADGVGPDRARGLFRRLRDAVLADADLSTAVRVIADEPDQALREVLERTGFRLNHESYSQLRAWIDATPARRRSREPANPDSGHVRRARRVYACTSERRPPRPARTDCALRGLRRRRPSGRTSMAPSRRATWTPSPPGAPRRFRGCDYGIAESSRKQQRGSSAQSCSSVATSILDYDLIVALCAIGRLQPLPSTPMKPPSRSEPRDPRIPRLWRVGR